MLPPLRTMVAVLLAALPLVATPSQDAPTETAIDKLVDERPRRIERHRSFRTITFERHVVDEGLELYVQSIPRARADRIDGLKAWYGRLADKVEGRLDEAVLGPARVGTEGPRRPVAVVVLASNGDWSNFLSGLEKGCARGKGGAFDAVLGAVVALEPAALGVNQRLDGLVDSFAHGFTHALLQAHAGCNERSPRPLWLVEGLARYAASCTDPAGKVVRTGEGLKTGSEVLAERMLGGGYAAHQVLPFADMLRHEYRWQYASEVPMPANGDSKEWWSRERALGRQGAVLIDLLLQDDDPDRRAGFLEFVGLALADENVTARFTELCGIDDLKALEVEFWSAVWKHRDRKQRGPLPEAVKASILRPSRATGAAPAVATPMILFAPRDAGSTLDRAAWLARSGDLDGALSILEALARAELADERSARELDRLTRAIEARDAWLTAAVAREGILRLEVDGKKKACRVVAWEEDQVTLEVGRKDVLHRTLAELPLEVLGKAIGDTVEGGYLRALGGDRRWQRDLPEGHGDDHLEADVEHLDRRAQVGRTVDALVRLEDALAAEEPLDRVLDELQSLEHGSLDAALEPTDRSALRSVLRRELIAGFSPDQVPELLHATEVFTAGDQLYLTYEFEDEAELLDFLDVPPLVGGMMGFPFDPSTIEGPGWRTLGGALVGKGQAGLHHKVPLGPPMTWRCNLRIGSGPATPEDLHFRFSFLEKVVGRSLVIANRMQRIAFPSESGQAYDGTKITDSYFLDQAYEYEMEIDREGAITMRYEGEEVYTGRTLLVEPGSWGLGALSNYPIGILRLEIGGSLAGADLGVLAETWAEQRLGMLGL